MDYSNTTPVPVVHRNWVDGLLGHVPKTFTRALTEICVETGITGYVSEDSEGNYVSRIIVDDVEVNQKTLLSRVLAHVWVFDEVKKLVLEQIKNNNNE